MIGCLRLTLFVESHHHRRRAEVAHFSGMVEKLRFALFHRDRIDDRFTLHAF